MEVIIFQAECRRQVKFKVEDDCVQKCISLCNFQFYFIFIFYHYDRLSILYYVMHLLKLSKFVYLNKHIP